MAKIRTVIVDDEAAARRGLRLLLNNDPDVKIIAECRNGLEAVATLKAAKADLMFLDIQMPGMDGFEVLRSTPPKQRPVVVFVTAYNEYALKAFETHALDYVLKPYSDERFRAALNRVKKHLDQCELAELGHRLSGLLREHGENTLQSNNEAVTSYLERIPIRSGIHVVFINTSDIDWIEANGDYVLLHIGSKKHQIADRMKTIENKLNPKQFVRIHRSAIVNIERIKEVQPYFHGDYIVILKDSTELRLSRRRRRSFESALGTSL